MKCCLNDWVVFQNSKRPELAKVVKIKIVNNSQEIHVKTIHGEDFPIYENEVMANLGKDPNYGKCFGIDTTPIFKGNLTRDKFLAARIMGNGKEYSEQELEEFKDIFDQTYDKLNSIGLSDLANRTIIDIHPAKKFGSLNKMGKDGNLIHIKTMEPVGVINEIFYQFGQIIFKDRVTDEKLKAKWVEKFHQHNLQIGCYKYAEITKALEELKDSSSWAQFKKESEAATVHKVECFLDHLKRVHQINKNEFICLMREGEDYQDLVPDKIEYSTEEEYISKRACRSTEKFFGECFQYWATGQELDDSIVMLIKKTLGIKAVVKVEKQSKPLLKPIVRQENPKPTVVKQKIKRLKIRKAA
jgi:hypothetical protein